jgi:rfaE bifunctional protein kinase chain/domain
MMKNELLEIVNQIQGKKVLVIGDMVADVYLHGRIARISREAPVLVLEEERRDVIAGGAANVVHNAATLGGDVWAVGVLGDDASGHGLVNILQEKGVNTEGLLYSENRATITKTRVVAGGLATVSQQIVRIDNETKCELSSAEEGKLMEKLGDLLPQMEGVVISDYGSKTLSPSIVRQILYECRRFLIPTIVDSRYGLLNFVGIDYVKQNEAEAAAIVGFALDDEESLFRAGEILLEKMQARGVLITRGDKGMVLFEESGAVHVIPVNDKSEVYDVSGAGDTCVAAVILALAAGVEPHLAAELSNIASGIAVRKLGTATVSDSELRKRIGAV